MDERSFNGTLALTWAVVNLDELVISESIRAYGTGSSSAVQSAISNLVSQAARITVGGSGTPDHYNAALLAINQIARSAMDNRVGEYWDQRLGTGPYDSLCRVALGTMTTYGDINSASYVTSAFAGVLTPDNCSEMVTMFSSLFRLARPNARATLNSIICLPDYLVAAVYYVLPNQGAASIMVQGIHTLSIVVREVPGVMVAIPLNEELRRLLCKNPKITILPGGTEQPNALTWDFFGNQQRILQSTSHISFDPIAANHALHIGGLRAVGNSSVTIMITGDFVVTGCEADQRDNLVLFSRDVKPHVFNCLNDLLCASSGNAQLNLNLQMLPIFLRYVTTLETRFNNGKLKGIS